MPDSPPARDPDRLTPELVCGAIDELLAIVDERLPERFDPDEPVWRSALTALIARMAGLLESIGRLAEPERGADVLILLRALYEHAVTFMWLAIDPGPRVQAWYGHTMVHRKTLHHDAAGYGATDVLSPKELASAKASAKLPPVDQRATDVDDYWGPRVRGFLTNTPGARKEIRTVRGLYVAIYRLASRQAHAHMETLDAVVEPQSTHLLVRRAESGTVFWAALASPVFSMTLVVARERLGWPDEDRVREINDALLHDRGTTVDEPPE